MQEVIKMFQSATVEYANNRMVNIELWLYLFIHIFVDYSVNNFTHFVYSVCFNFVTEINYI